MKTTPASFKCSKKDQQKITSIAKRAVSLAASNGIEYGLMTADMDITACHCNGMELDLDKLAAADDSNFAHDVFGIRRHIDRETGQLKDCFVPRYAAV